jgi:hypothetical protein
MSKKIIIIGVSGLGKVIADIALRNGYEDIVFLDDDSSISECASYPIEGETSEAEKMTGDKIVAIGNPKIREQFQEKLENVVTLIHPDAVVIKDIKIPGTYVGVPARKKTMSKHKLTGYCYARLIEENVLSLQHRRAA